MGFLSKLFKALTATPKQESPNPMQQKTAAELQKTPVNEWPNRDVLSGATFCATMQLRTPLRILKRHNEEFNGTGPPPAIPGCGWDDGIWVPKTKTFKELGIDLPEFDDGMMASDIGEVPLDGGDYLKFLLAVREIVEKEGAISCRLKDLNAELGGERWKSFVRKHGGKRAIAAHFFPRFIDTIPGLNKEAVSMLLKMRLDTPNAIAKSADEKLLSVKGIGPAKLLKIKSFCESTPGQDSKYLDIVKR